MFLKKNNTNHFILVFSSIILVVLNVLTEFSKSLNINSLLIAKGLLVLVIVFIFRKLLSKHLKKINLLQIFIILLFSINILLNIINVYQLGNNQIIKQFCDLNSSICPTITSLFYKLKIFRFITLSSYFFTIPIYVLLFSKYSSKIKFNIKKYNKLQKITFILLFVVIFSNLAKGSQAIYLSTIHSFQVANENYYDRFTFKRGGVAYYGWIRVFSNFIIENTSEKVSLLVPPQSDIYKMEGNIYYFRWFMYPRSLYHLEDLENDQNEKTEYIVISAGECNDNKCVWPDYEIDKSMIKQIIIINRETQKIERYTDIDYVPINFYNKWGLIELK